MDLKLELLQHSKQFMSFFKNNNHLNKGKHTSSTKRLFKELYLHMLNGYKYLQKVKKIHDFFKSTFKEIKTVQDIRVSEKFGLDSIPKEVVEHLKQFSKYEITFTFSLFKRNITVYFIIERKDWNNGERENKYLQYVHLIFIWIYMLEQYASQKCSKTLKLYFYMTGLCKELPKTQMDIINQINVNTGFTTTCPEDSEIVIYRKEEWFKVLIHESFHNFGLDFSDMNNDIVHQCILRLFHVKSEVNLFETYTEFWAEIINALFCSFISLKKNEKTNFHKFLSLSEYYINFERTFSFFQLVKILHFMGLHYSDLFLNMQLSKTKYREKTNVLAYYILKTILLHNYQLFLLWCKNENTSLLQFNKSAEAECQKKMCQFIYENYNQSHFLKNISSAEQFFSHLKQNYKQSREKDYVMNNLQMTICQLG